MGSISYRRCGSLRGMYWNFDIKVISSQVPMRIQITLRSQTMARTGEERIEQNPQWEDGLRELREILLDTGLNEEVKWGSPMYTLEGKNVVGLLGFKSYMGLWFHMGVFLEDSQKLLERSSDTTKSLRKMVFHSHEEFSKNK